MRPRLSVHSAFFKLCCRHVSEVSYAQTRYQRSERQAARQKSWLARWADHPGSSSVYSSPPRITSRVISQLRYRGREEKVPYLRATAKCSLLVWSCLPDYAPSTGSTRSNVPPSLKMFSASNLSRTRPSPGSMRKIMQTSDHGAST